MYVYPVYRHAILAICACVSVCMFECVCVSGGVLHVIRRRPTLKVMKNESFAIRSQIFLISFSTYGEISTAYRVGYGIHLLYLFFKTSFVSMSDACCQNILCVIATFIPNLHHTFFIASMFEVMGRKTIWEVGQIRLSSEFFFFFFVLF